MDVWLVNPYGPLPGEGWRDYRFTLVGRALAGRGHRVTWWTAAFAHQAKRFRSHDWATRTAGERFTIELVPTPSYTRNVGLRRLWFEWVFSRRLCRRARSLNGPDLVIAADPPQFSGAAGRLLAKHFGVPLVVDCLDLWPELFISVARPLLRPFVRMGALPLFALRRRNLRAAELVIAVSDAYRRALAENGPRPLPRAITIPIGVDVQALAPATPRRDSGRMTVVYAGSLGEAYDLHTVIDAAAILRREGVPVGFVIAGHGPAERRLRDAIGRLGLTNAKLLGAVPVEDLPQVYANADIAIAPYIAGSTVALPVKLFDYMAAGLPVVTSLRGEAMAFVEGKGIGLAYVAGDAQSLARAVRLLISDAPRRRSMSAAARAAALDFDVPKLYDRYAAAVESLVTS